MNAGEAVIFIFVIICISIFVLCLNHAINNYDKKKTKKETIDDYKKKVEQFQKQLDEERTQNGKEKFELENKYSHPLPKLRVVPVYEGYEKKYSYDDIYVAGTQYYEIPNDLKVGDEIKFIEELDNEFDPKAIAVYVKDIKIGHVHKNLIQDMIHDFWARREIVNAYISEIRLDAIKMVIDFYVETKSKYEALKNDNEQIKSFKLTGNTNEEMQANIYISHEGESVTITYDYDKEKYLAKCSGLDIGYFLKSANDYLESIETSYEAYIEEIYENENDKYCVRVIIGEE